MDFDLSDEQALLKDSVERMLAARYGDLEKRKAYQREPGGYSRALWQECADLGLMMIPFAEEDGGLGQGLLELALVGEAIGRNLALEPFIPSVVLCGGILRHGGSAMQRSAEIAGIASGERVFALAQGERRSRYDLACVGTTAVADGKGGFVIDGEKVVVAAGDHADRLIVVARTSGVLRDREGITLFVVDSDAPGISRNGYATQDGQRAADIAFTKVTVSADAVIGPVGGGLAILERAVDETIAVLAAEAVGAMDALTALTVDFLKTRTQFGVPIASFQVLQHRAVDMFTMTEQARSMASYGTMMAGEADAAERRRAMAAVKVQIGRSAQFVGESAVQLHGGIGMTAEYKAGHYFKRLTVIDLMFGDADHHLKALARAGGLIDAG